MNPVTTASNAIQPWDFVQTGYEPVGSYWEDFSKAEQSGAPAIEALYNQFKESALHREYIRWTEISLVLNHKAAYWDGKESEIATVYKRLWEESKDLTDHWNGREEDYYWQIVQPNIRYREFRLLTAQEILEMLTKEVKGSDKMLFTVLELRTFARSMVACEFDERLEGSWLVKWFMDYWCDTNRACQRCAACGKLIRSGYLSSSGKTYYCSMHCKRSMEPDPDDADPEQDVIDLPF